MTKSNTKPMALQFSVTDTLKIFLTVIHQYISPSSVSLALMDGAVASTRLHHIIIYNFISPT